MPEGATWGEFFGLATAVLPEELSLKTAYNHID
jgi:hypothetical protein